MIPPPTPPPTPKPITKHNFYAEVIMAERDEWLRRRGNHHPDVPPPKLDIDTVLITGSIEIIPALMGELITLGHQQPRKSDFPDHQCLLAKGPMEIYVASEDKEKIVQYLSKQRGHPVQASESDLVVLKGGKVVDIDKFMRMMKRLRIFTVGIKCYGMKSSILWGLKIFEKCRDADQSCEIKFDFGIEIDPIERSDLRRNTINFFRSFLVILRVILLMTSKMTNRNLVELLELYHIHERQ